MTLPSSGYMSLDMIRNEFGGGNPVWLSNYYAGGPYVPAGAVGANGPIPSSGYISVWHFYGATKLFDTQTINVGFKQASPSNRFYGFTVDYGVGSISDGTCNFCGGAPYREFAYFTQANNQNYFYFSVEGSFDRGAWTYVDVGGMIYYNSNASYFQSGGRTYWQWPPGPNPFTAIGSNVSAVFH